jgi:hypothetical protein
LSSLARRIRRQAQRRQLPVREPRGLDEASLRAHIVHAVTLTVQAQTQHLGFGMCAAYASTMAGVLTRLTRQSHRLVVGALHYRPSLREPQWRHEIPCDLEGRLDKFHMWALSPHGDIIDPTVRYLAEHWRRERPEDAPEWHRPDLPSFVWEPAHLLALCGLWYAEVAVVDRAFFEQHLLLEGKS